MNDTMRPQRRDGIADKQKPAMRLVPTLPLTPLTLLVQAFADRIIAGHPEAFARLRSKSGTSYRIAATDIGIAFLITLGRAGIAVKAMPTSQPATAHVSVEAPIRELIALLEGESDGDALFFARGIQVTGDTEALLMLRNAVDSADIDFHAELLALFGPAEPAARYVARLGVSAGTALLDYGKHLQARLQAGPLEKLASLGVRVSQLEHDLKALQAEVKTGPAQRGRPERTPVMRVETLS